MPEPLIFPRSPVITVSSKKGGVGKTTLATNLAVYVRALLDELPVLLLSLDDQSILERMFALGDATADEGDLRHGWVEGDLRRVIRLGNYGVHFVAPPRSVKASADDPRILRRILDRTRWEGLTICDTRSDLEGLTVNALFAADRVVIPVCDWASLEEAGKTFQLLERVGLRRQRARILFNMVDHRARLIGSEPDMVSRLRGEAERRGWPSFHTFLSRSHRVHALGSSSGTPLSILHHARGTRLHQEMHELAKEVIADLELDVVARLRFEAQEPIPASVRPKRSVAGWRSALLRGLGSG